MAGFIAYRLLYVLPISIGVSLICFALTYMAPGDPASSIIPDDASPEVAAQIRAAYGFDRPLPVQYLLWLWRVLSGDFGVSLSTGRPVTEEVIPAMMNTLSLAGGGALLAAFAGITLGTLAAYRTGKLSDRAISAVGIAGMSVPQYWIAMVMVAIFAVELGVLPASGMGQPGDDFGRAASFYVLPILTLATVPAGIIARSVRSTVAETLQQEFVQALEAKGLPAWRIFLHVAKNAAGPALAVIGLQFANLLGGSILVETVFSWPGTGFLLNAAIFMRDLPVMQATVLLLAMFFIVANLLVDILQMLFDPRVKTARRG